MKTLILLPLLLLFTGCEAVKQQAVDYNSHVAERSDEVEVSKGQNGEVSGDVKHSVYYR